MGARTGWLTAACALILVAAVPSAPATAASSSTPVLSGLSVARGDTGGGTRLTLYGSGFTGVQRIAFGSGTGTAVKVLSSHSLTVTSPRHAAGTIHVRVRTAAGYSAASSSGRFAYTAPLPVTGARVTSATDSAQTLTWTLPHSSDLAAVVVRRASGTQAPTTPAGGTAVPVAGRATSVTVRSLAPSTTYSYAIFAHDHDGQYSAPARLTTTTACRPARVYLSGTVSSSRTWSPACVSSYVLTGPVTVPAHITLTLAAGTTVQAQPGAGIEVAGALVTQGTASAPVRVTAATASPQPGDWPGITVGSGGTARLAGVELRDAATALQVDGGADVVVRGRILDSTVGVDSPQATVDARHVDWGSADGPSPMGSGTPVTGAGVFATPWAGFAVPPRPAPAATVDTPPSDTTCADVAFLGARGSGEAPQGAAVSDPTVTDRDLLGPRITPILDALTTQLAGDGAGPSVRTVGLRYAAAPPPFAAYSGFTTAYYDAIWAGVDQLEATLAREQARCPQERVVLAGYSQGALITHLALAELARRGLLGGYRIAAVELVADPARTATDADTRYGAAAANSAGVWTVATGAATPLPAGIAAVTAEICHLHDPVCAAAVPSGSDYRLDPLADGEQHANYPVGNELDQLGRHAADRL